MVVGGMSRPVLRSTAALLVAGTAGALACVPAGAASTLTVKGRGFGHGVGMSQYGAYGYAKRGRSYTQILGHYYQGTKLARLSSTPDVGVLLSTGRTKVYITQATRAGSKKLSSRQIYNARTNGTGGVILRLGNKTVTKSSGAMRLTGSGDPVMLRGSSQTGVRNGEYRGSLEVRPNALGRLNVTNTLDMEDYVRGVVSAESPSSWPAHALRAQAVAARTYALTTNAGGLGDGFTQYADTRSQVYRGVAAETASTDDAIRVTSGQVVTYKGDPITTFFFSTSGGRTENVENSFLGADPKPYLRSVRDPYDKESPKHTWTLRFRASDAQTKLGSLLKGSLKGIVVDKRGKSPRVIRARIVGTRGTTTVSGPTLRAKLGLYDTWASFQTVSTRVARVARPRAVPRAGETLGIDPDATRSVSRLEGALSGVDHAIWLRVQRGRGGGRWQTIAEVQTARDGAYAATVPGPGVYRVRTKTLLGPNVRVRP